MLIECPECKQQISTSATACPHCGYPLKKAKKPSHKRRRLPNGFGQISEIKGRNLSKPFRVMVSTGKDENGRPVCKILKPVGFFATYNDAYSALMEYHKSPYSLETSLTFQQLYEQWSAKHFASLKSDSSRRTIEMAWSYCSELYQMPLRDIRARHLKSALENGVYVVHGIPRHTTPIIRERMKILFNQLYDYAIEYELIDKNYARTFKVSKDDRKATDVPEKEHMPYTDWEMETLWANRAEYPYIDMILIQCYSGWRPQELCLLEIRNINLSAGTMQGGMKTRAGIDRIVPIHSRIRPIIEKKYQEALELGSRYLFNCTDGTDMAMTYDKFYQRHKSIVKKLYLNDQHSCHDGRKHFVTQAKKYQVDEYAIKRIVGHEISDITEKVYTQRDLEWLRAEIEKIK